MSTVEPSEDEADPIVIHRSVNRDGATFALDRRSLRRIQAAFGSAARFRARLFITHEGAADFKAVQGAIAPQVVLLLTGLSEERLQELGGVIFLDPVTEEELPRTAA